MSLLISPINGGSGDGRSLRDVVATIADVVGAPIEPQFRPGRTIDVARSVLDISLARQSLGWSPQIAFDAAVAETWAWLQEQKTSNGT